MITVRFSSGFSVQYNRGAWVKWGPGDAPARIYPSKKDCDAGTNIIAGVPRECVIEFTPPCRAYNAAHEESDTAMKAEISALRKEVWALSRKIGKTVIK